LGALPARHVDRSQLPSLALVIPQAGFLPWLSSTDRLAVAIQHHGARGGGLVAAGPAIAGAEVERLEDQALHQQVQAFAGGALHHRPDQREADVRVTPVRAGCVLRIPGLRIIEQRAEFAIQRDLPVAGAIGQAGRVREQQAQGDLLVREGRIAQCPAQRVGDIGIQVELALFDQAHHPDRQHQLADRGDAYRIVDGDRALRRGIGIAFGAGGGDAVAVEGHAHARLRRGGRWFRGMRAGGDQQEGSDDAGRQAHGTSDDGDAGFYSKVMRMASVPIA